MTSEEYREEVQPALARFCGWECNERGRWRRGHVVLPVGVTPDPLHRPEDALDLLEQLLKSDLQLVMQMDKARETPYGINGLVHKSGLIEGVVWIEGKTMGEALVLTAWAYLNPPPKKDEEL